MCRYLASDALDSDDSDDNDEDDDDDQPDKFEGSCDDENEESHQSKLDEMLAKFRTRVRSLRQEQSRQVTTKFGNINQKPLEQTLVPFFLNETGIKRTLSVWVGDESTRVITF